MYLIFAIYMDVNAIAGSFHFGTQLPEKVEKEEKDKGKRKELSEHEEGEKKKENSAKKKRKQRRKSVCDEEEEQAGPSSPVTPGQRKKSKKICLCKLLATDVLLL